MERKQEYSDDDLMDKEMTVIEQNNHSNAHHADEKTTTTPIEVAAGTNTDATMTPPASPGSDISSDPPSCVTQVPRIRKVGRHKFAANIWVRSFCEHGVLVWDDDDDEFVKWNLPDLPKTLWQKLKASMHASMSTSFYLTQWKKSLPSDEEGECCVLADERIAMSSKDTTTIFSEDLEVSQSFPGDFGLLRGAIGDMLLYAKEALEDRYRLDLYRVSDHSHVHSLSHAVSSRLISICYHNSSGWFALTDDEACTLDVYTSDFTHQTRVKLQFQPMPKRAVSSVRDYIFIVPNIYMSNALYVYNWEGEEVTQVHVDGDKIWGTARGGEVLQVWSESKGGNEYLHVYHVK